MASATRKDEKKEKKKREEPLDGLTRYAELQRHLSTLRHLRRM